MKHFLGSLLVFASCLGVWADEAGPTPQDRARQIIAALQNHRSSQIKSNLTSDTLLLEKGTKDFPSDPLIHFALAILYAEQEKTQAVRDSMEKAYNLSQKDPGIGNMYVLALKMNKEPIKAYALSKQLVALHPESQALQIQLATLEMTIQKYDESLALLKALEAKSPPSLPAEEKSVLLLMQGTCWLYQGNYTKAIEALEESLNATPKMTMDLVVLGEAYLKIGDLGKANECFDKVLAKNQANPSVLYYKGMCLEKAGNTEAARGKFERAYTEGKKRLRDNGEDYYLMFLICQKLSKDDEAKGYKAEAAKLGFSYEAPWKQK